MRVIITSPSINTADNISGISSVTQFIVNHNNACNYTHFVIGRKDGQARNLRWLLGTLALSAKWFWVVSTSPRRALIHFNLALDTRSLIRDLPLIMFGRLLRRRTIVHIHGGELISGLGFRPWMRSIVDLTLARRPVVVLSQREKAIVEGMLFRARVFVLPNCIPMEDARNFERTYADGQPLTILFLGRITLDKGVDVMYESLTALKKRGIRFRLVLAGAGPEEKVYVPKFQQLLGKDFDFRGVVSGAAKTALLKECDVFLLPSLFEGMPMALLESMAFGLVAIATSVGSIPSVVVHGRNGILVSTRSHEEILEAIEALSADRRYLASLSRNARSHVLQTCKPSAYVRQLNEIYQYE